MTRIMCWVMSVLTLAASVFVASDGKSAAMLGMCVMFTGAALYFGEK